jgi:hypothetical protein
LQGVGDVELDGDALGHAVGESSTSPSPRDFCNGHDMTDCVNCE